MTSLMRNPKDFWTGVIYLVFGAAAIVIGRDYELGTATNMGPAYFPTALGFLLSAIGIVAVVRAWLRPGGKIGTFALRELFLVLGASLLFGLVVRGLGLAVAVPVLVIVSAYASERFRLLPTLALAAGMTAFCILVFVKGLGVPLPILGSWLGG